MSVLICKLNGSRGRRIAVYDNKCVITTDVSLGSILTSNALDGQKTIFYIDVQGVQFKKCGMTLGYIQLETASMQMNNQTSNMFSENTFTFDRSSGDLNIIMEKIHDYIVDRIESYKYNTPAQKEYLYQVVSCAERVPECSMNFTIVSQVKKERADAEQLLAQEQAEKKQRELDAQQQAMENLRHTIQAKDGATQIELFLAQASTCGKIKEILDLWNSFTWNDTFSLTFGKKISEAAQIERMYGSSSSRLNKLIEELKNMI